MIFIHDTRDQAGKHKNIIDYLETHEHVIVRSKMYVGDIALLHDQTTAIDLKRDLIEVCGNVCQQHERFRREVIRAQEAGIQLVILIEHGHGITSIEDVERWVNPRLKKNKTATSGGTLAKIMRTFSERYGVRWEFCRKEETGKRIVEILGGRDD